MNTTANTPWIDKDIPDFFQPISLLIDRHISNGLGASPALSVDDQVYTYSTLLEIIKDHVGKLISADVRSGERVFLFGKDSLEYIAYWLAAIRIGAIHVVISDAYRSHDLLYFLEDTAARTLIIDSEQLEKFDAIYPDIPHSLKSIIVRQSDAGEQPDLSRWKSPALAIQYHQQWPVDQAGRDTHIHVHKDDLAYMFYSGGTTGRAKGITHLSSDFIYIPERQGAFWSYRQTDVVFATSRKYFTHGLWPGVLIPLYWGAHSVISRKDPTAENIIALVEKKKPNKWITVPTIVKNIVVHVNEKNVLPDFSSITLAVTASEKMPIAFFEQFQRIFAIELLDSIGSAEVTYEWIANRPEAFRRGSIGKPVFGYEIRLIDSQGNIVTTPNTKGQAEVYSTTGTPFYWRKRTLSQQSIIDGWIKTGDELYYDEDGFYWFAARSNDVFKVKGLWISPLEIEEVLVSDIRIQEAAVVSYQDQNGLTKPAAYLVLAEPQSQTHAIEQELSLLIKEKLGGYKIPGRFFYIDQLPKTTLLKVDRRWLRDQLANQEQ